MSAVHIFDTACALACFGFIAGFACCYALLCVDVADVMESRRKRRTEARKTL